MAISLKHAFESAIADGVDDTVVQPSDWNAEHTLTMATSRVLGRITAGTGAAEELTAAQVKALLDLEIGTDVQAWSTHIDAVAALAKTDGNIIVGDGTTFVAESGATARTSLGVGTGDSPQFTDLDLTGYLDLTEISAPATPSANHARIWAEDNNGFSVLHWTDSDSLDHEISRDLVHIVRNTTGSAIPMGSAVYISGSTGSVPNIALARANSTSTMPAYGITTSEIAHNSFGQVMTSGDIRGLNTAGFSAGDVLYVSATTPGALTTTIPTGTDIPLRVGVVITSNASQGVIGITIGASADPAMTQTLTNKTLVSPIINTSLEMASGSVIDWNNGDVTLTHSAGTLDILGAGTVTFADDDGGGYPYIKLVGGATPALGPYFNVLPIAGTGVAEDFLYGLYTSGRTTTGVSRDSGGVEYYTNDPTNGAFSSRMRHYWSNNNAAVGVRGSGAAFSPDVTDTVALGSTALQWSDLFLASGSVINFANGDAAITHSSGVINVSTGTLQQGGSPVVLDSDIGSAVQAYSAILAGTTASFTTADETKLDAAREALTAARTYYVRTDGSDSNDGLANTAGGAKLTIAAALSAAAALDCKTYDCTIQVGAGTWTPTIVLPLMLGSGTFTLIGDTTTPSNCTISTTSANCITATDCGSWVVRGFKMQTTTSGNCIEATGRTTVLFDSNDFGVCAGSHHIIGNYGARITCQGNYSISGGSAYAHMTAGGPGVTVVAGTSRTITVTANVTFSIFAYSTLGALIDTLGNTYSLGAFTVTGTRYYAETSANIRTFGGGASYFPGTVAGSTATGGNYS